MYIIDHGQNLRGKKMKLIKTKGKTKDFKGCEFPYTIYSSYEWNGISAKYNNLIERIYEDDFFGNTAKTLKELKDKVSKL